MTQAAITFDRLYARGTADVSGWHGRGYALEDAALDQAELGRSMSSMPQSVESITEELPSIETLQSLIQSVRAAFVRQLASGLLESAIRSYDTADWEELGQAIVDWASTLELEADRALMRRMRRRRVAT